MHQIRDDIYVNGEIVRRDYTLGTLEGLALLKELRAKFPEYRPFGRSRFNMVGKYDGYREPYVNTSISWYDYLFASQYLVSKTTIFTIFFAVSFAGRQHLIFK